MSPFQCIIPFVVHYMPIVDFPGYKVGDDGSVWSCWKQGNQWMPARLTDTWRRLKPRAIGSYPHIHFAIALTRDGKRYDCFIHRLVLEAFIGPCPPGMEGCHYPDRDVANNWVGNLRWDTRRANMQDQIRHGTASFMPGHFVPAGEDNWGSKLTNDQVEQIMAIRNSEGLGARRICRRLGLPMEREKAVSNVIHGQTWNHLTGLPSYGRGR